MNKVIDISQWQGRIPESSWEDIKRKVNGVIIRLGYRGYGTGVMKLDDEFTHNLAAVKRHGIPYGVYFFTQAMNAAEAQEEVSLICKNIDIKAAELGVWCDSEMSNNGQGRGDVLGKAERTVANKAFIDAVNARGGHGGLYCGFYWLRDNLIMNEFSNTPFWLACYMSAPLYQGNNLYLWQFTSLNGFDIAGFGKSLDCSWQYKGFGQPSAPKKSVDELAHEVLGGKWGNGKERVADSRHARVKGSHMSSIRQQPYTLFQVGHGRILHSGIVGSFDAIAEGISHLRGITKFKRNIIIYGYGQRAIGIGTYIGCVNSNSLFLHNHLNIEFRRVYQSGAESIFNSFVSSIHL
jgi:GH25 family lysozyme M1 (1,4-beta-N-acetylmuramidase)